MSDWDFQPSSVSQWPADDHRRPEAVRFADRAWRAKERAQHVKPVSTKIAFYSPKVDTVPGVKPRGRGK